MSTEELIKTLKLENEILWELLRDSYHAELCRSPCRCEEWIQDLKKEMPKEVQERLGEKP